LAAVATKTRPKMKVHKKNGIFVPFSFWYSLAFPDFFALSGTSEGTSPYFTSPGFSVSFSHDSFE
jgi:hypothetical protein